MSMHVLGVASWGVGGRAAQREEQQQGCCASSRRFKQQIPINRSKRRINCKIAVAHTANCHITASLAHPHNQSGANMWQPSHSPTP